MTRFVAPGMAGPGFIKARWLFVESPSRIIFLFEHDLFGKPVPTFPDHALAIKLMPAKVLGCPAP
jgi:hypothetical protein